MFTDLVAAYECVHHRVYHPPPPPTPHERNDNLSGKQQGIGCAVSDIALTPP